jgi:hypothetical protein
MTLGFILLVIVFALLLGALPAWPQVRAWGRSPGHGMILAVLVVIALLLVDRL